MIIDKSEQCIKRNTECNYYCKHNEGCALLITKDHAFTSIVKDIGPVDCNVYRDKVSNNVQDHKQEETSIELPVSNSVQEFDYSSVDSETAEFLQDKARNIISIKTKAMIDIAIELKEVHEKLSNHYQGTFGTWCKSIGMTDRTARNYLSSLDWVRKNFPNIEDSKEIQTSLLFAVSKPSAAAELQEEVLAGNITTHKQYKELEDKLKVAEKRADEREIHYKNVSESYKRLEQVNKKHYQKTKELSEEVEKLNTKIKELESQPDNSIEEQKEIDVLRKLVEELQEKLNDESQKTSILEKQLKEQPIEIQATRVEKIEILPEDVRKKLINDVESYCNNIVHMSESAYKTFIEAGKADTAKYVEIVDDVLMFLQGIRQKIVESADPFSRCGSCDHADMDQVTDDELESCMTYCTIQEKKKSFDDSCPSFKNLI